MRKYKEWIISWSLGYKGKGDPFCRIDATPTNHTRKYPRTEEDNYSHEVIEKEAYTNALLENEALRKLNYELYETIQAIHTEVLKRGDWE